MKCVVSSGVVSSNLSELKMFMSNYDSLISELSSSWKGVSYDSISSKCSSFSSEYIGVISGQMSSFAEACDLYSQYLDIKENLEIARRNYNIAVSSNDNSNATSFSNQISTLSSKLETLANQIRNALSSASSNKLAVGSTSTMSASAIYYSANSTGNSSTSGNGGASSSNVSSGGNSGVSQYITCAGGSHIDGLVPAMSNRISKLADRYYELTGENLVINSGSRTMSEQQVLYDKYGPGRAAAPSKKSPHIAGIAVDIDSSQADFLASNGVLEELGLSRPLLNWGASGGTNEPWHIELNEWRQSGSDLDYVNSLTE